MQTKLFILAVTVIGTAAAAGNLRNLFRLINFPIFRGQGPVNIGKVYVVPVYGIPGYATPVTLSTAATTTTATTTAATTISTSTSVATTIATTTTEASPPPTTGTSLPSRAFLTAATLRNASSAAIMMGYTLNITTVRPPCAPSSVAITKGFRFSSPRQCIFCLCGEDISPDIHTTGPDTCTIIECPPLLSTAFESWSALTPISNWTTLPDAMDYQLYGVPTGYCFIESRMGPTRRMQCFDIS